MKKLALLCVAVLCVGSVALAGGDKDKPSSEAPLAGTLSAKDLKKVVAPHVTDIDRCYLDNGQKAKKSTGVLRLELIIHRDGHLFRSKVVSPGVKGKQAKKLGKCLSKITESWTFPRRKYFTTATIPFLYLQTKVKGAGPTITCWSKRGCPKKWRSRKNKAKQKEQKAPKKSAKPKKSNSKSKEKSK